MSRAEAFARLSDTSPRPQLQRERSNSVPTLPAIKCTESEASIILSAAQNAAARRRRHRSHGDVGTVFPPKIRELALSAIAGTPTELLSSPTPAESSFNSTPAEENLPSRRNPAAKVEKPRSRPAIKQGPTAGDVLETPKTAASQQRLSGELGRTVSDSASYRKPSLKSYKADLADFIRSRLDSIRPDRPHGITEEPVIEHASCVHLNAANLRLFNSNVTKLRRPPLKSTFSNWSTTTDGSHADSPAVDESIGNPDGGIMSHFSATTTEYTPSIIDCYRRDDDEEYENEPSPDVPELSPHRASMDTARPSTSSTNYTARVPSSLSSHNSTHLEPPAPARSAEPKHPSRPTSKRHSRSTGYLDSKDALANAALRKNLRVLTAISPCEGGPVSHVYDIVVQAPDRVVTEGMTFDLVSPKFRNCEDGIAIS